jgi:hypothetical protein
LYIVFSRQRAEKEKFQLFTTVHCILERLFLGGSHLRCWPWKIFHSLVKSNTRSKFSKNIILNKYTTVDSRESTNFTKTLYPPLRSFFSIFFFYIVMTHVIRIQYTRRPLNLSHYMVLQTLSSWHELSSKKVILLRRAEAEHLFPPFSPTNGS